MLKKRRAVTLLLYLSLASLLLYAAAVPARVETVPISGSRTHEAKGSEATEERSPLSKAASLPNSAEGATASAVTAQSALSSSDDLNPNVPPAACPALPPQGSFAGKTDFNTVKSQLWFNDGSWWGIFSDGLTGIAFHKHSGTTFVKGAIVDGNIAGKPDVIWDGTNLFVMVYKSGAFASFFKYSYSSATQTYTLLPGFPVNLNLIGSANILNIEKDSTGKLWAAYTGTLGGAGDGNVRVIYTVTPDHTVWDTNGIILHSGFTTGLTAVEEVAAIVHYGGNRIGVAWSNQTDKKISFRHHLDGDFEFNWSPEEVLDSGLGPQGLGGVADDHMSIKAAPDGRIFLIAKDDDEPLPGTGANLHLYVRQTNGTWSPKVRVNPDFTAAPTRPILLLDLDNKEALVFYRDTSLDAGSKILLARSSMDSPSFSTPCTFIDTVANNTTGTKQNLNSTTDLLMAASTGTLGGQVLFNTIDITGPGIEADANNNGSVSVADWVKVGRYAAGLDSLGCGSEFRRVDCSPRSSFGNGFVTISDWVQAGRYAAGLDPTDPAEGPSCSPSAPVEALSSDYPFMKTSKLKDYTDFQHGGREIRLTGSDLAAGQQGTFNIVLDSQGNENAIGFTLTFDTSKLSFVSAVKGADAGTATLNVNTTQLGTGRVGIALALPSGEQFAAGARQLVVLTFAAGANATGQTTLDYADSPIVREVVDPLAEVLTTTFTPFTFSITGAPNPVPVITTINPTSVLVGSPAITLTVNGSNFVSGSVIRWNGSNRSTTFVNSTQLTALIPATDLASAGVANITVNNPSPGGGTSNTVNFSVNPPDNPLPTVTSISPQTGTAGGSGFVMTVTGTNFASGAVVRFNGSDRTTTFVNSTQLTAQIIAADMQTAGTFPVVVVNPAPGGGSSNTVTFTVVSANPVPAVTSLSPSSAIAGGAAFTLTVNGSNFVADSVVRWNGVNRTTAFVSPTRLTAQVLAADISDAGNASVNVFTPGPGGGSSTSLNFVINNPIPTISGLSPSNAVAGVSAFTLTVNGAGFVNGSVVRWNGSVRPTSYVNPTQLTAFIGSSDVSTSGVATITVLNPAPGGGTSNPVNFPINPPQPNSRELRVANTNAAPGKIVSVPVELVAQGDENALGFSLNFDPAQLIYDSTEKGSDALSTVLNVNVSSVASGRLGIALSLSSGEAFPAGVRQLLMVKFSVPQNGNADTTQVSFGDQPVPREISNVNAQALLSTYTPGTITIVKGYEGDVSPRPTGDNDGSVTILDWNQTGRFSARLDTAIIGGPGGEYQRADCSPMQTLGDGFIGVTDWVQAGRYAAGLDPVANVGGPTGPPTADPAGLDYLQKLLDYTTQLSNHTREARVVSKTLMTGQNGTLSIELVSEGNENALGFSLNFDPAHMTFVSAAKGSAASNAALNINSGSAALGRVGFALALPAGEAFAAGAREIVVVTFAVPASPGVANTQVSFGDQPIPREIVDVTANNLNAMYTSGTVTFQSPAPVPSVTTISPSSATAGGAAFTLTVNGTNFVNGSVVRISGADRTTTFVNSTQLTASIPATDIASAGTLQVTVFNPAPGGGTSNSVNLTVNNPSPTITTLSPSSATAGGAAFTLTVNGTNFVGGSVVRVGGADRTTTFVNSTQLTASIPATDIASAGTLQVTVFNPTPGGGTSAPSNFAVNNSASPTITSLSPSSATAGGAAFTLTVNGANFVNGSTVRFNGVDKTTTFVNSTQLTASITAADIATAGTFPVTVSNPAPGGGESSAVNFAVNNPTPSITTLSPASATAGGAAFTLTVNGANFVNGSGVLVNGSARTTTFVNSTQLTAQIPATDIATAGTLQITVFNQTPGGGTSSAVNFAVNNPAPTITTLSPSSATAGGAAFTLTVNGTNFVGGSVVRIGGADRTTTFVNSTQLTASIPATDIASAGTLQVTVFNPAPGGGASAAANFSVNNPSPTITSLNPSGAQQGSAAFTLTVNGTNFVNSSVVRFNGVDRTTTFVNSTQLTASIPASDVATAGTFPVTVFNPAPGGGASAPVNFEVTTTPLPSVSSISPNTKTAGDAAFTLTVNGTNFVNGSVVRIGGADRTTTFVNSTQLTASIPATDIASAGTLQVTVFNPAPGGGTSNAVNLTVNNPSPTITTLSPSSATAGGAAFTLTVNGANFVNGSTVRFNGVDKTTTFINSTQLTASITAADIATAGTFPVTVSNPAPGGGESSAVNFAVNNPTPSITTLSPASATAGGAAFTLTVNGTGFINSSVVRFNGVDRTTTFVNSTQLTASIPASDIATAGTFPITVLNPAPGGGASTPVNFNVNAAPIPDTVQFDAANYNVTEDCTLVSVRVTRSGNTAGEATVEYSTSDGTATERADYTTTLGKLIFKAGETEKIFAVPISEDSYVEGNEQLNLTLTNPSGVSLGGQSASTLTIIDDANEPQSNPIDDARNYVCQQYHDFLNRQPDDAGLNFWSNEILSCGGDGACILDKRVNVSAAFFLSIEFQQTGYLVYRLHEAAFNTGPLLKFKPFLADTQEIGRGVVVLAPGWEQLLEQNKVNFIKQFVERPDFLAKYPLSMTAAQFVDGLNANSNGALSQVERDDLVAKLSTGAMTRAEVLRAVADDEQLQQGEFNRAFVFMQYLGYLRRNPDDAPDNNLDGYNFWLGKLNQFNGNFVQAEMVKAFILSGEYRQRFGQ